MRVGFHGLRSVEATSLHPLYLDFVVLEAVRVIRLPAGA